MKKLILFLIVIFSGVTQSKKLNFCSITLNSNDEIEFFKENLNKDGDDFNFIELTQNGDDFNSDWMEGACERTKNKSCDVLLISGHFAGEVFFGVGKNSGRRVFTHHLLDKVCNESCDHILKHPKLVFLFGGHTLSEKAGGTKRRKRELVRAVKGEIGPGAAHRLAEARYGPYGKAYLEQMKRVFSKNATILGFDGKGLKGRAAVEKLKTFLGEVEDLKSLLDYKRVANASNSNTGETVMSISPFIGESFKKTFGKVDGVICDNNKSPISLEYRNLNSTICNLSDEGVRVDTRLEMVQSLMRSTEQLELTLPWIEEFFRKHPPKLGSPNVYKNKFEQDEYKDIQKILKSDQVKSHLEKMLTKTSGGFTKYQILALMRNLGILDDEKLNQRVVPILKAEFSKLKYRGLDQDTIDLLCQMWPTFEKVNSGNKLLKPYGKRKAWGDGIKKLNSCIRREKRRFGAN